MMSKQVIKVLKEKLSLKLRKQLVKQLNVQSPKWETAVNGKCLDFMLKGIFFKYHNLRIDATLHFTKEDLSLIINTNENSI